MPKDMGFGGNKKLDLAGFQPEARPERSNQDREQLIADDVAERKGFTSREPTKRVVKNRRGKTLTDSVYIRAPIELLNDFKTYCNNGELTYAEALEQLLSKQDDSK